ncbi:hypothetical protein GALL_467550 [mine drainage metagenome]|uniref:Uncharacterized protein n=1 Tax=mine drainage metagenome TaxID=410659 RepID=A0A1J5PLD5_9ZZZZ
MLVSGILCYLQGFRRVVLFDIIVDDVLKRLGIKKVLIMISNHFFVPFYRKLCIFGITKFKFFFHSILFQNIYS